MTPEQMRQAVQAARDRYGASINDADPRGTTEARGRYVRFVRGALPFAEVRVRIETNATILAFACGDHVHEWAL